jgi:hypothetical protein
MKPIIILISLLVAFSCKAQNIIEPIYKSQNYGSDNVYYKDIGNDYNTFEGTWVYTNGNTSLTIVLEKKTMKHIQDAFSNYYEDALIGEYQYIEDGIEQINTLSNLTTDYDDPYKYNIHGGTISKFGDPHCYNCEPNNKKVFCTYNEPNCDIDIGSNNMVFRYFTENGVEKIQCVFKSAQEIPSLSDETSNCTGFKLPFGEYILIKQ